MRLVHLSDLHLGYRQYQRQTAAGINQREADVAAVFRGVIDSVIALAPDVVVLAGDIFHNVRPPNPAILHAFGQFSRLTHSLPKTIVVMIAGNHDEPRSSDSGCILRLFTEVGVEVVHGAQPRRIVLPERELAILAVPDAAARAPGRFRPDAASRYNVLVAHGGLPDVLPPSALSAERSGATLDPDSISYREWTYVALGHYHVFRQLAPNACYSGSIEYTSPNSWGERDEERRAKLPGKGFVEYDLSSGKRTFHPIKAARDWIDLRRIEGKGLSAADIEAALRANIARIPGGIDDKIVRQVVRDVPRHVAREIDHRLLRELKKRALHFHLDTRRPDILRVAVGQGAAGRRASLMETVRDKLRARPLPAGIDRDRLVERGLHYLADAEEREGATATGLAIAAEPDA